jgi:hypothetical protein
MASIMSRYDRLYTAGKYAIEFLLAEERLARKEKRNPNTRLAQIVFEKDPICKDLTIEEKRIVFHMAVDLLLNLGGNEWIGNN